MMRFRNRRLWPLIAVTPLLGLPLIAEPAHSQWRSAHAPAVQPISLRRRGRGRARSRECPVATRTRTASLTTTTPAHSPSTRLNSTGAIARPWMRTPTTIAKPSARHASGWPTWLLNSGRFVTEIAFAVVEDGELHFADAFSYVGQGQYVHNPAGVNRLLSHRLDQQVRHGRRCQGP